MSVDPTRIDMRHDPLVQRFVGVTAHGEIEFDVPYISYITGNLWMGGCMNGLVLPDDIEHVISLYAWESYTIRHQIRSMLGVLMHDSEEQGFGQVDGIARWVNDCCEQGPTLVHCQAGLNRSALIVARALMLGGREADSAIFLLRQERSPAVLCNPSFEAWLRSLDDEGLTPIETEPTV